MDTMQKRHCFVTVGSIASFRDLLSEIIQPKFLEALKACDFGVLEVQCGPDYDWFKSQVDALPEPTRQNAPAIRCFAYTDKMKDHMLKCRGVAGGQAAGCVISHAGMCLSPYLQPIISLLTPFRRRDCNGSDPLWRPPYRSSQLDPHGQPPSRTRR